LTNQQLYLSIGIPSVLIILAWLSNRQDLRDLSSKVDRNYESLNAKIDRHYENFNNQVTALLTTIHTVSERVTRVEGKQG
jgi:hypothetical protein